MTAMATAPAPPIAAVSPVAFDPDFERRWSAWKAHGVASERAFNRQARIIAAVIVPLVLAALALLMTGQL